MAIARAARISSPACRSGAAAPHRLPARGAAAPATTARGASRPGGPPGRRPARRPGWRRRPGRPGPRARHRAAASERPRTAPPARRRRSARPAASAAESMLPATEVPRSSTARPGSASTRTARCTTRATRTQSTDPGQHPQIGGDLTRAESGVLGVEGIAASCGRRVPGRSTAQFLSPTRDDTPLRTTRTAHSHLARPAVPRRRAGCRPGSCLDSGRGAPRPGGP